LLEDKQVVLPMSGRLWNMKSVYIDSKDSRYESEDDNMDVLDIMAAHLVLSGFFICVFFDISQTDVFI